MKSQKAKAPGQSSRIAEPYSGQTVLGHFVLEKVLGDDTFATTWRAQQTGTNRKAVVKIAHPHLMDGQERHRVEARFAAEFTAASEVQHPCLVTVYTLGKVNRRLPAIVMEHLPGQTMAQVLQGRAPLATATSLKLAGRLASALVVIHKAGIIHRDVSPQNIILSRTNQGNVSCKLTGFGAARIKGAPDAARSPLGSPLYVAPEQLYGQCTYASDVYSLGAIMWWMLTGKELHHDPPGAFDSDAYSPTPDICQHVSGLPKKVGDLMRAMLWPDPNWRLSARECVERLALILNSLSDTSDLRPSLLGQTPKPSEQPSTRPKRRTTASQRSSTSPPSHNPHPSKTTKGTLPGIRHTEAPPIPPPKLAPKDIERFTSTIPNLLSALERALNHRQDTRALGLAVEISRSAQRLQSSSVSQAAELIIEMKCAGQHTEAARMLPSLKKACGALVVSVSRG